MGTPSPVPPKRRKKKVVGGHGAHGGAWKVAYADFVTAMMAFFMIMWLLASSDDKTRKEISNYFRTGILPDGSLAIKSAAQLTPSVVELSPVAGTKAEESSKKELAQLAQDVEAAMHALMKEDPELAKLEAYVKVRVVPEGVVIEAVAKDAADDLLFESASSRLKPALEKFLNKMAPVLAARGNPLEIQGNTDAVKYASGAGKDNWDLSYERAAAAREILSDSGVNPGQIIGVVARGAAQPFDGSDPYAASNRRLSILLRKVAPQPGEVGAAAPIPPTPAAVPAAEPPPAAPEAGAGSARPLR